MVPQTAIENIALVESIYEAFDEGDVDSVLGALDPEVSWITSTAHPQAGEYSGRQAVEERMLAPMLEGWSGMEATIQHIASEAGTVIAVGEAEGRSIESGHRVETTFAHVWTIEEGKVVAFREILEAPLSSQMLAGES